LIGGVQLNTTPQGPVRSFPVQDWVAFHARVRPESIALRNLSTGETRSWLALEGRVARLAGALLHTFGLRAGDRIVCLTDGDIRVLELQFACIRAGLTLAPLNFRLTEKELADLCRVLAPKLMVTDASWRRLAEATAAAVVPSLIDWDGPTSAFESSALNGPRMAPRSDMRLDEVPLILCTSGSTGAPKAATSTLEALLWQAFNQIDVSCVAEAGAHVFTPLPLFHAGGLNSLTNPVLYFGGQVTISARFDAAVAARFLGDPANHVTHIALVPLMYKLIGETPEFLSGDYSGLRTAIVAGGRMPPALQQQWAQKGVHFSPQYGGTETGPSVTALPAARTDLVSAGSIGTSVKHVQIRLVNEAGIDVPVGAPGEIWLKGPAITRGYVARAPELDFTDGWFRTGDVATVDEQGFYYLVDRLKDMYKSGGENVSSLEVEQVLAEHPDVAEVAVIGIQNEKWGEVGLALVVPRPGTSPTLDSLRAGCEGRLARYKHPYACALLDSLPRNVTGKVAKDELRRRFRGSLVA
jgi:fatty-acyl-CoA synthase